MSKYLAPSSPAAGTAKPAVTPAPSTQVSHIPGPITATPEQVRLAVLAALVCKVNEF